MYIAIAGNIGSGKSLLADLLSNRLGLETVSPGEECGENPYLDDFYDDMKRWSFELQVYFLGLRWRAMQGVINSNKDFIIDRTIYEDAEVFAKNLYNSRLLSGRGFDSYYSVYSQVIERITPPNLLVYLRASHDTLLRNIKKRGREYEANIDKGYLKRLNELYEDWTFSYSISPILVVDIDRDDIVFDMEARGRVLDTICQMVER